MIIQAAVTHSDLKKSMQISLKYHFQIVATLTNTTTYAIAAKFSRHYATI